jgi:small subunit ribosomal protein S2
MITLQHKDLLDARVHFGHLASKWHPNMAPFIFMKRNGIHIIDLKKTLLQLQKAAHALRTIAKSGQSIFFVATKKQAKEVVEQEAKRLGMPYITERWLGGTLTNFATIRKLLKKMSSFDKFIRDTAYQNMAKKEQLMIFREKEKLERLLQGIANTTRIPAALFVVDIKKEHIAVKEAKKLGIPVFALTDTNTDPTGIDYPIPSNDDSSRSIELIIKAIGSAIEEGLAERENNIEIEADTSGKETEAVRVRRERNVAKVTSSRAIEKQSLSVQEISEPATKAANTKVVATKKAPEVEEEAVNTKASKATTVRTLRKDAADTTKETPKERTAQKKEPEQA